MSFYTVRPLSDRTRFTGRHKRSPFEAAFPDSEELLRREIRMLSGYNVVVELDVFENGIRVDGGLKARARVETPGVRVAFTTADKGDLAYATDRFTTWQDNFRAIALGLEALRKFGRYGLSESNEQYVGFRALGAGTLALGRDEGRDVVADHHGLSRREAAGIIERAAVGEEGVTRANVIQRILSDSAYRAECIKQAKHAAHPDQRAGDRSLWDDVDRAARALA